jgi:hypothetical protein
MQRNIAVNGSVYLQRIVPSTFMKDVKQLLSMSLHITHPFYRSTKSMYRISYTSCLQVFFIAIA